MVVLEAPAVKVYESPRAKCVKCGAPARIRLSYANAWFCDKHFREYVKERVKNNIIKYNMVKRGETLLVAVSGGKDSVTLMSVLDEAAPELGVNIVAVHIVLGMGEFSEKSLEAFRDACSKAKNVKCVTVDLKELLGMYMPEIIRRSRRPACSVCGLVKRYILNAMAVSLGASAIATGHHMNDLMTYAIKNFMEQKLDNITKLGPVSESEGSAVKRVRPLYDIYEDETRAFVKVYGLNYVDIECPFKSTSTLEVIIKDMLSRAESESPSLTISAARALARNLPSYPRPASAPNRCRLCGMPSNGDVCGFCKLTKSLTGAPLGPEVRSRIEGLMSSLRTS
ncbi:ATP-binding protein [Acidilobus sp.]|uniref:ATP-binding protein n=1 Tax=Acidilobus sp. TaxID=1872109 RepID=UPI003D0915DA